MCVNRKDMEAKDYKKAYQSACTYLGINYNQIKCYINSEWWLENYAIDNDLSRLYSHLYDISEKVHNKIRPSF